MQQPGRFIAALSLRRLPLCVRLLGLLALASLFGGCNSSSTDNVWSRLQKSDNWVSALIQPIVPTTPSQAARDMFNVYDADSRRMGVALISGSPFGGEDPYLRAYRLLEDDPDPVVRGTVAQALGLHGDVSDAPALIHMLKDKSDFVRWQAALALTKIHDTAAAEPLIVVLQQDEDVDARSAAAYALGQYAEVPVFDALVGALNDIDYSVADSASRSLYLLTGTYQGTDGQRWIQWADAHRGDLFADQQLYTYEPWWQPKGFFWWITFWKDYGPPDPEIPVGLQRPATAATPAPANGS